MRTKTKIAQISTLFITHETNAILAAALLCALCVLLLAIPARGGQPAIDADIIFAERNPGRDYAGHYYADFGYDCGDENYWLHGADGGRLAILNQGSGEVRTLIEDAGGAFRDPVVHYDGKKVFFSYRKGGTHHYNLYSPITIAAPK
jgi:hypothetical protein